MPWIKKPSRISFTYVPLISCLMNYLEQGCFPNWTWGQATTNLELRKRIPKRQYLEFMKATMSSWSCLLALQIFQLHSKNWWMMSSNLSSGDLFWSSSMTYWFIVGLFLTIWYISYLFWKCWGSIACMQKCQNAILGWLRLIIWSISFQALE